MKPAHNPRLEGLVPLLDTATVTIVGLGGGAEIAFHLLRSGVRSMWLFDNDVLESGNLVRHSCSASEIGQNKAIATKQAMERHVGQPLDRIRAIPESIFSARNEFTEALRASELLIVATDTDSSRYFAAEMAADIGRSAIFVSMFQHGCGGEAFVQRPDGACFWCLNEHMGRKEYSSSYQDAIHKGDCSSSRDATAQPGLGVDQAFLAALAARKGLDLLLESREHALLPVFPFQNWILWSLTGIPGVSTDHARAEGHHVGIHPDCPMGH